MHKYYKDIKTTKIFLKQTLLVFLILWSFSNISNAQTSYTLGNYKINPTEQKIWVSKFYHENLDGGVHAWGERYILDSTINYNSTTLLVIGNHFFFKEHISKFYPPQLDLNTFKVINID